MAKSHEAIPFGFRDISSSTLHFKAIFNSPLKKVVKGPLSPLAGALVRLGHSLARLKILGRSTP